MSIKEDASTNDIIQWLNYYKMKFVHIDYDEVCNVDIF